MYIAASILLFIIAGFFFGDWRHWKLYQSTVLYLIMCDLAYLVLSKHKTLWAYTATPIFGTGTMAGLAVMFMAYPANVLIYLPHFPKRWWKAVLYVMCWVLVSWFLEWLNVRSFHELRFSHGWNLWNSGIFYVVMYVMLKVHFHRPLIAYGLSIICAAAMMWMFHIPLPT